MKKMMFLIFVLLLISIAACQQTAKKEIMKKKAGIAPQTPAVETTATGNAAVDAVGNDLNNVNSVEKDLSADQLSDVDYGLADVQNI